MALILATSGQISGKNIIGVKVMFILDAFYYFFYLVLVITLSNFSSIYAIFCHISCQFAEVLDQNIRRCGANVLARL